MLKLKMLMAIVKWWFELILDKQPNRLVGVVYRHPFKKDHKSIELINTTILKIKKENKSTLLVGDFNYDLLSHEKMRLFLPS